jgi:hypothetical protein
MEGAGLDSLGGFFNPILEYFQTGFNTVNAWQGLLVALIAVVLMKRWGQLLAITMGAALAYILVEHFWPIITQHAEMRLPNVTDTPFWQRLGAIYVGLLIIIAMFFAVKSVVMGARGAPAKKH